MSIQFSLTTLISVIYESHFLLCQKQFHRPLAATWLDRRLLSDKGKFCVSHSVTNLYGPPRSQVLS